MSVAREEWRRLPFHLPFTLGEASNLINTKINVRTFILEEKAPGPNPFSKSFTRLYYVFWSRAEKNNSNSSNNMINAIIWKKKKRNPSCIACLSHIVNANMNKFYTILLFRFHTIIFSFWCIEKCTIYITRTVYYMWKYFLCIYQRKLFVVDGTKCTKWQRGIEAPSWTDFMLSLVFCGLGNFGCLSVYFRLKLPWYDCG